MPGMQHDDPDFDCGEIAFERRIDYAETVCDIYGHAQPGCDGRCPTCGEMISKFTGDDTHGKEET